MRTGYDWSYISKFKCIHDLEEFQGVSEEALGEDKEKREFFVVGLLQV